MLLLFWYLVTPREAYSLNNTYRPLLVSPIAQKQFQLQGCKKLVVEVAGRFQAKSGQTTIFE